MENQETPAQPEYRKPRIIISIAPEDLGIKVRTALHKAGRR